MARSLRTIELISEDLPTFGRPMIAMARGCLMCDVAYLVSAEAKDKGTSCSIARSNSEIPRLCSALTDWLRENPSDEKSDTRFSCLSLSILLLTSITGFRY